MPVEVAVIGCGQWGANHVRVLSEIREARVALCVDADAKRLAAVTQRYPGVRTTAKVDDLCADKTVQAVVVATPSASHHAVVKACLEAGKDVLCEKPLTVTAAQSRELVDLAEKAGRILMVGHVFVFNQGIQKLRELISTGVLGEVYYLHAARTNLGPIRTDVNVAYDLATHDISIFNHLLGAGPSEVSARGQVYLSPAVEDVAFISLAYPGRALAHVHVSWLDPRKVREITVVGDRKMAVWNDMDAIEPIRIYDKGVVTKTYYETYGEFHYALRDGDIVIPKIALHEPLKAQDSHFVSCVAARSAPISSGRDGWRVVQALEAIQQSMRQGGAPIKLPSGQG
ncbi:MAG: Gfo/Idh/MocA family oxidoreductase [Planctomycetes bacterium]|nr:Gfo/Idh/MocA family oxidoreductase [Planctomycetota bacterium]